MIAIRWIRSRVFDAFAVLWTILLSPSLPVLWLLRSPSQPIRNVSQLWVRGLLWGLRAIVGLSYKEEGRQNIPKEPCIIVSNHQSAYETLILSHTFSDASFISKHENARIPAVGWYLKHYPMIMIDRKGGARTVQKLVEQCRATLADGRSIILFPEGTRKDPFAQIAFKRGLEFLYSELDASVLPVAVNTGLFWPKNSSIRNEGTATISYLPVVMPGSSRSEINIKIQSMIEHERDRIIESKHASSARTAK